MTSEEQRQYNELSYEGKRIYNRIKTEKPHWSHNQVFTKTVFEMEADGMLDDPNKRNIKPTDPEFWKPVLEGAKRVLTEIGGVAQSIFDAIDTALSKVENWIRTGISYIGTAARIAGDIIGGIIDAIF